MDKLLKLGAAAQHADSNREERDSDGEIANIEQHRLTFRAAKSKRGVYGIIMK